MTTRPLELHEISTHLGATHRPKARVTVHKPITRAGAQETLKRLFFTDKDFSRAYEERIANFVPKPKRRGGRVWTKLPNQPIVALPPGTSAKIRLSRQYVSDIKSVYEFVNVQYVFEGDDLEAIADSLVEGGAIPSVVDNILRPTIFPLTTTLELGSILPILTRAGMINESRTKANFQFDLPAISSRSIPVMTMDRPGNILHLHLGEVFPKDITERMRSRAISEVYLDVSPTAGQKASADVILTAATALHKQAASAGVAIHPVVVGPVNRRDHELLRELAQRFIRISPLPFARYKQAHHTFDMPPTTRGRAS